MSPGTEVSVVIPTHNRWELLSRAALPSAVGQQDVEHEVIVVDDGSEDGTSERLAELAEPRIRSVRLAEASGVARARNRGIEEAAGTWIAFLDDDDVWSPRKLRAQLDAAAAARASFVYAGVVSIDDADRPQYVFSLPRPDELPHGILVSSVIPAGCSNVLVRTDLVRSLGGFDEALFQLADWDLWIRLAWAGAAALANELLVGYREHDDNMLLSDRHDVVRELDYLERKHRALRAAHGVELDSAGFLHWVAWGQLRRGERLHAARTYLRSGLSNRRARDVALAAAFAARSVLPLGGLRGALQRARRTPVASGPSVAPDWLEREGP